MPIIMLREFLSASIYSNMHCSSQVMHSFCLDVPELPWFMDEIVGIGLGDSFSLIRLLDKIFIPLLLRESYSILFCHEIEMRALQRVPGSLPPHQRMFPSMTLLQNVPIHSPMMGMPRSRLRRCLCRAKYSDDPSL